MVEKLEIPHESSEINDYITVSMGVSTVPTIEMESIEEIIARADKALYNAKDNGRNRVEVFIEKAN